MKARVRATREETAARRRMIGRADMCLHDALYYATNAPAPQLAAYIRRVLKSSQGAMRHADRLHNEATNYGRDRS